MTAVKKLKLKFIYCLPSFDVSLFFLAVGSSSQQDRASPSTFKEDKEDVSSGTTSGSKKDIRALIGLELVVDYVKEPKEEPQPPSPTTNI